MAKSEIKIFNLLVLALIVIIVMSIILFATVLYAIGTNRAANQNLSQKQPLNKISVSAQGYASAAPQDAKILFFINATGDTSSNALLELASKTIKLNSTLSRYVDGNMSRIKTEYFSVQRIINYPYNATLQNSTNKYVAQQQIEVSINNTAYIAPLVQNATKIENLQIEQISATLSNAQISNMTKEAIFNAVENATNQARAVIGNATIENSNITLNQYYITPFDLSSPKLISAVSMPSYSGPVFFNGTDTVSEQINIVFYYK